MNKVLKGLLVFLFFIVVFSVKVNRVYGQCGTVFFDFISEPSCREANVNLGCPVEPERPELTCWNDLETGKCVGIYYWTGCYDQNIEGVLQCVHHKSVIKIDCESPEGGTGTGPSYIYNRCPSG
ncbi:MAG: hypothetical protein UR63_C0014G0015, partial [Candidatus Roizmanbacteria bacterium GW2011_GWC2_35_12]